MVSNASCTTNCLAPVAQVLNQDFNIVSGFATTIHSYTGDQGLLDSPHPNLQRARAAALSMIPSTTGAAKAIGLVLPELEGKLAGTAIRVPTPNVSLVDLTVTVEKAATVEQINSSLTNASTNNLDGVLAVSSLPLVSSDYNHDSHSATVDLNETYVLNDHTVRVLAWYDNEWGFSNRMVDTAEWMAQP